MANLMRRVLSRWRYSRSVWAAIRLLLQPSGGLDILVRRAYPGISVAIRHGRESGERPEAVALQVVTAILTRVIEDQMDPAGRRRALLEMGSLDEGELSAEPLHLARVFTTSMAVANEWVTAGLVDSYDCEIFVNEVTGALHGEDSNSRRAARVARALQEASGFNETSDRYLAKLEAERDEALAQAVAAVRRAEQRGTLAPDPRSDAELKESIRRMWEAELEIENDE